MGIFLKAGEHFSGCKILSLCGRGAFGITYLAENPIGQKIIIKIISVTKYTERESTGLQHYMQVSGSHPNLLQVFHIGEIPEGFYYTMEAADDLSQDGRYYPATLGNLLRQGKCFTPEEAVRITRELLAGINVMHAANLIHRDIKPDNIIFVNGKAKLSDPGLVIEAGKNATLAGTPGFIPPEMLTHNTLPDKTTDLYAIGKVFYCMVTGNPPHDYPQLPENMKIEVCRQLFPALSQMCNTNPAKRFKSAGEFLSSLPQKIEIPTRIEMIRNNFRDWKILNREKYQRYLGSVFIVLLLCLCLISYLVLRNEQQKEKISIAKEKIRSFQLLNQNRMDLLSLQLEMYLPQKFDEFNRLSAALSQAQRNGKWLSAAQTLEQLKVFLTSAAITLLPVIPEKADTPSHGFNVAGKARGYLSTPLAVYLDPAKKQQYTQTLRKFEKTLYRGWSGPTCTNEWHNFNYYSLAIIFVPPGAVKMSHSGKKVRIPYHFWIGKYEISHKDFTHKMGIAPHYSPHPNTPVERVAWNDILYYCRQVTLWMQRQGVLPPGYIIRPPTETEWEYAAQNAWLGKDTIPFEQRAVYKDNSNRRSMPPGSKHPNKLGLFDIYGNVSEIVMPFEKPAMHHAVMLRGGSFLNKKSDCFRPIPYLRYQYIPYDIGFRIVLAPGDMSYFDKHFFVGGAAQIRMRGKVYELIGANLSSFNWEKSDQLSRLLGGRLAEIEDQQHLDALSQKMPLAVDSWGCFVGGRKINGKWKWIHSQRDIDFGEWYPATWTSPGEYLTVRSKKWKAESNYRSGIFLCEWDEKDYPNRNRQLTSNRKLPGELTRFSVGNRNFMLIASSMYWYAAYRFCQLLGGRIACLDTPELKKTAIEKLQKFRKYKILLGGYAKFDKWFWLSGKEFSESLKTDNMTIPSLNRNFITLLNGEFHNSQYPDLLLFEWSNNSSSSI